MIRDRVYLPDLSEDSRREVDWDCTCGGSLTAYGRHNWHWVVCEKCGQSYSFDWRHVQDFSDFEKVDVAGPIRAADLSNPADFEKAVRIFKELGINIKEILDGQ